MRYVRVILGLKMGLWWRRFKARNKARAIVGLGLGLGFGLELGVE